jgi:hypothetical protein
MRSRQLQRAALLALRSSVIGFGTSLVHAAEPPAAPPVSSVSSVSPVSSTSPAPPAAVDALAGQIPFEWFAPEGCPDRAAVLKGLAQLLDADATSWDRFENVRGRITRSAAAFELELEFISGRRLERRTFATRDCADLAHAAAVTLALVLDPAWDWTAEPTLPRVPQPSAPQPSALPRPSVSSEVDRGTRARGPRPAARVELQLGAEGVLDTATLGPSAFGLGLSGRARMAQWGTRFGAELFGAWLPPRSIDVRPTEAVELGLMTAGVRACNWPTFTLGLCAEIEAGRLSASGVGDHAGRQTRDLWVAPGASVVLESRLFDALLLDSRVSLLAPLTRPQYFVNYAESVHEVPAVTVRVAFGVALAVN